MFTDGRTRAPRAEFIYKYASIVEINVPGRCLPELIIANTRNLYDSEFLSRPQQQLREHPNAKWLEPKFNNTPRRRDKTQGSVLCCAEPPATMLGLTYLSLLQVQST